MGSVSIAAVIFLKGRVGLWWQLRSLPMSQFKSACPTGLGGTIDGSGRQSTSNEVSTEVLGERSLLDSWE